MENSGLLQKIAAIVNDLSPKQLILAHYVEGNYSDLAYTTMTELARMAGVSETTVVRFIYSLGYKRFPDFMDALRSELTTKKENTLMSEFSIKKGEYEFPKDTCRAIFAMEMQVMNETLSVLKDEDFIRAVDTIFKAKEVIIVGCGANSCCMHAMLFALQVLKPRVYGIEKLGLTEEAYIRTSNKDTVCIAFTTPRYPAETQRIIEIVKERAIPIIGISNSLLSPIFTYCDIFFQIPEKYVTYIDSNASYMALIHALTFAVCQKDKAGAKKHIAAYNAFARKTGYYVNGEVELVEVEENL